MGGKGSGRKPDPVKQFRPQKASIAGTPENNIELPNYSGIQNELQNGTSTISSDDLAEGSTNLFYKAERVDDRVNNLLKAGNNINLSYDDKNDSLTINANQASSTAPSGNDREIQFNDSGNFGSDSHFKINSSRQFAVNNSSPIGKMDVFGEGITSTNTNNAGVLRVNRTDGRIGALIGGGNFVGFYFDENGDFGIEPTDRSTIEGTGFPGADTFVVKGSTGNVEVKNDLNVGGEITAGSGSIDALRLSLNSKNVSVTGDTNNATRTATETTTLGYEINDLGDRSVGIGWHGGRQAGSDNSIVGWRCGQSAGKEFIAVGKDAGLQNGGDRFVALGYQAVDGFNEGSAKDDAVGIGYRATASYTGQAVIQNKNLNSNPLFQGNFSTGNVAFGYGNGSNPDNNTLEVNGNELTEGFKELRPITKPSSPSSGGRIYINSSNGDLEIIFSNGTTKTIASN